MFSVSSIFRRIGDLFVKPCMSAEEFKEIMGHAPTQDDLHRVNCKEVGTPGHMLCGICCICGKPNFACGGVLGHAYKDIKPKPIDLLEIPGHPDCLDVGKYALHVLKEKGINPHSDANVDAMTELENKLSEVVGMFMGQPITVGTKHEIKTVVRQTIILMENAGTFSRW